MNTIATFRKCTLTDEELIKAVDKATDDMYKLPIKSSPPSRHIPARPNEDYDLLVGELLLRFQERLPKE
jgi:hypothetical protein